MTKRCLLESPVEYTKPTKYYQICVKSVPKPCYASDRLIVYGKGLTKDRARAALKKSLKYFHTAPLLP